MLQISDWYTPANVEVAALKGYRCYSHNLVLNNNIKKIHNRPQICFYSPTVSGNSNPAETSSSSSFDGHRM
jgi:hypothetical protein